MKTVFDNCTILKGPDLKVVEGYVIVEDGIIIEVGDGSSSYPDSRDMKGAILCPSFTNAHTHLGDSPARDLGAYEPIEKRVARGGIKYRVLEEKKGEVTAAMKATMEDMKRGGTGAFCDFREGGLEGVRQVPDVPGMDAVILGRPDGDDMEDVLEACDGMGISSPGDYPEDELKEIRKATRKHRKILAVHTSEVEDDLETALAMEPDLLVHGTNLTPKSIGQLKAAKVPLVMCARANATLGVGIPDIHELFISTPVGLGTDNVMIQEPDMLREMEFVFKTARGQGRDHTFDARAVLQAATLTGREILGLTDNAIKEGNPASFIVVTRRKYIYDSILAIIHRTQVPDIFWWDDYV